MVNSEAISEISHLVEHHLSIARKLQEAIALLAPDASTPAIPFLTPPEGKAVTLVTGNGLTVANTSARDARKAALQGIEFRDMPYNNVVVQALRVWGPELPRPFRKDIIDIMKRGGFTHPEGTEAGARQSIRNAAAIKKYVFRLRDGGPDGEYALREWFPASYTPRKKSSPSPASKEKEPVMVDPLPDEQTIPAEQ